MNSRSLFHATRQGALRACLKISHRIYILGVSQTCQTSSDSPLHLNGKRHHRNASTIPTSQTPQITQNPDRPQPTEPDSARPTPTT